LSSNNNSYITPPPSSQVGKKNMLNTDGKEMDLEQAVNLVHDLFISACEREIHTGDSIAFKIITKNGIEEKTVGLRRD
jgi:20S proteasome subunit beta 6